MKPSISIIVPCFNGESFIKNTLNSIKSQTFSEWECIIIDDGSTDKSKKIITDEIHGDTRFHLIAQENKGVSYARNHGIKLAKANYIFFLDADDSIPNNALSDLFNIIQSNKNIDIVIGQTLCTNGQEFKPVTFLLNEWPKNEILHNIDDYFIQFMVEKGTTCIAQNRLYRLDFLKNHNLEFYTGILHEDMLWYFETMFFANTVFCSDKTTYYYNVHNENSITKNIREKNIFDYLIIIEQVYEKYYLKCNNSKTKDLIGIYILFLKMYMLELFNSGINLDKKETFKKIKTCFDTTIVERNVVKLNKKIEKKIFILNYILDKKNEKSILILNFYGNRNFFLKLLFKVYKFIYQKSFNKINKTYYKIM
ncbi:glycosyltransferase family 2 protein [Flavobacterium luminosum]|uniref:Glycosyltransferase n=1 Tax=Flavobacterium luminosum TaxID=2949086 RepID=A0ABT0TMN1_9FLAO|nr:glycosyltransferase [Flavobacterium sp. HXWNR70]MCL9808743.1 glycosyltransferase [Flavobacterium sp. HXWNR70]